ncbi:MAG: hypothetical protein Q8N18_20960 [Opitutaceae bacterium]|nr:hypothetical protein [Opitutaceae bacterium]
MKKRIVRIAPLKAGIVLGVLYALLSVLMVPIFLIVGMTAAAAAKQGGQDVPLGFMFGAGALLLPVLYGIAGFIGGIIAAAVYNLVAKWTGGFEVTVENVA